MVPEIRFFEFETTVQSVGICSSYHIMPPFDTDHESHESPRIDKMLGFVRIRGILRIYCPNRDALRFCHDTGTIKELRIFVGFGWNRSNIVKNSLRFTRIDYEYCTNVRNQLRISWEYSKCIYESDTIKLNSWLFLTIPGISPQYRYKKAM